MIFGSSQLSLKNVAGLQLDHKNSAWLLVTAVWGFMNNDCNWSADPGGKQRHCLLMQSHTALLI